MVALYRTDPQHLLYAHFYRETFTFTYFIINYFFSAKRCPFKIFDKAGLGVMNSFSFCLSGKLNLSYNSEWLSCWVENSCMKVFFSFWYFEYVIHFLWPVTFLLKKAAYILMLSLYISCFSLAVFMIFTYA